MLTVPNMDSLDEILYPNESYRVVISRGSVIVLCKVVLAFESVDKNLKCDLSNESY